ncbi:MAG: hypothetical protein INR73_20260 [Williamsia sp.]|nr:hypothetical protein [Williamsia sp.]
MITIMLEQCSHETETHIRTLEHLTNENIQLRNRLTAIVRRSINPEFLEKAEYFHHQFIMEDEAVKIMRHDVALQEEALQAHTVYANEVMNRIQTMQVRLRKEMKSIETGFNKLKFDFYYYLGEFMGLASEQLSE